MTAPDTTTIEFHVTYDAPDGARRQLNAEDKPGVQAIIADLDADEQRRQQLAISVGLDPTPHQLNTTVHKVTTSRQQIQ